jgi:hypothetical protein
MKLTSLTAALAFTLVLVQSAQAHVRHHQHHQQVAHPRHRVAHHDERHAQHHGQVARHRLSGRHFAARRGEDDRARDDYGRSSSAGQNFAYSARDMRAGRRGGRPAAWCGWMMRQLVSQDPGPSFNLARNWAHWGRPGRPGIGAVVVWPHHVGKIVGHDGGTWVIRSGNDDHAVRTRPRSIAGAIAIRWG